MEFPDYIIFVLCLSVLTWSSSSFLEADLGLEADEWHQRRRSRQVADQNKSSGCGLDAEETSNLKR